MSVEPARSDVVGPGPDLHHRIGRIVVGVVVLSRITVLVMVALSAVTGVQSHFYTDEPLAAGTYAVVVGYALLLIMLVLRSPAVPAWAMIADVAVVSAAVIVLPYTAPARFFLAVANSDFEPVTVTVAVAVALITASAAWTSAACLTLAVTYTIGQAPLIHTVADVSSMLSPILWQVATACCCWMFIRRLRMVADAADIANRQVLAQRERLAAERAEAEADRRHFREQLRRHRALHDGPLRTLTALAGPGPLGHPDERARRQCAIAANILRGTTPDDPQGTLTDLSLALIEAASDSAAAGLRVEYHFVGLPDDLPPPVVQAFARASAEALTNVATHAGTDRARLTALTTGNEAARPTVTVAIVDQGKGYDPATTPRGYGIRHSILDRMSEVGGDASLDSHPGQGTRVDLRWPA